MKDIQGFQRGKCNKCECEEYRSPPPDKDTGRHLRLRCEYCDHTPVDHVKIIQLGACNKCGEDNCDKYESDDPNSYTECQYCGCDAKHHAGAEKLKKPSTTQRNEASGDAEIGMGLKVRMDSSGNPVQDPKLGTCKFPGCTFPKRVENGLVHDFCSRTCSIKYGKISFQTGDNNPVQVVGFTSQGAQGSISTTNPQTATNAVINSGTGSSGIPLVKMCSACKSNPANAGHAWCQRCYLMATSQKQ